MTENNDKIVSNMKGPVRDLIRGLRLLINTTGGVLEPASRSLPEPLTQRLRKVATSVERVSTHLLNSEITNDEIVKASKYFWGSKCKDDTSEVFCAVFAFALEQLQKSQIGSNLIVSETILKSLLPLRQHIRKDGSSNFSAKVLFSIREGNALAKLPGLPSESAKEDRYNKDLILIGISVWLLTLRASTLKDEIELLNLSYALTRVLVEDSAEIFSNVSKANNFLTSTAACV